MACCLIVPGTASAVFCLSYSACPVAVVQIVSQAEAQGEVAVQELADIQGQTFDSPRVLVSNQIGGMEDIPVSLPAIHLPNAASNLQQHTTYMPMLCWSWAASHNTWCWATYWSSVQCPIALQWFWL